jgi:AraC-like DNA-binding protein
MLNMKRQTRPSGPSWPVDEAWKRQVKLDMRLADISLAEMARRIKCSPSALTVLFREETKESRLVSGIHRELGRPAPAMQTNTDETLRRINMRWASLTKEQRALIDHLVEQLLSGSR